jgi:hypothetical protein
VHLAVFAREAAVPLDHRRRVVVEARHAPLEEGDHEDYAQLPGQRAERVGARSRHRFGQVEVRRVFRLAEVESVVQLLQHHQLRARFRAGADAVHEFLGVGAEVRRVRLLDKADFHVSSGLLPGIAW